MVKRINAKITQEDRFQLNSHENLGTQLGDYIFCNNYSKQRVVGFKSLIELL